MKRSLAILLALTLALTLCGCGAQSLTLATGSSGGTYAEYGQAMADVLTASEALRVSAVGSAASRENIDMIAGGKADIAFAQNDVMDYAYGGTALFEGDSTSDFLAIASLYTEACHIIARPEITSVAQLKSRNISMGGNRSGTWYNALHILGVAGVSVNDCIVHDLDFNESAAAYNAGEIDAFFITEGVPAATLSQVTADYRLVSLDFDQTQALSDNYEFYAPCRISAGTYDGYTAAVDTVAVRAVLIADAKLPYKTAYDITRLLFENTDALADKCSRASELSLDTAVQDVTVPFHPGALKYYTEMGVTQ